MYRVAIALAFLGILVFAECGVVNLVCKVKEHDVFRGAESIPADYVQFRLYTNSNREDFVLLNGVESIRNSAHDPNLQTIFIVHGYRSSPGASRLILLKEFLLMRDDFNVIIVDWEMGASEEYMPHAIRNAFASAQKVASFIELLAETSGINLNGVHIIGFSLGAQLSSFVGKRLRKIGRISALDPAGPCFSLYGKDHRIHYTDAEFVDVIITNGDGFGMKRPSGHVNFMVQGGVTQSECGAKVLEKYYETYDSTGLFLDSCSHQRAVQLYIDSLNSRQCVLVGYSCSSYQDFLRGECTDCGQDGRKCAPFGYNAIEYKPKIGNETRIFYLKAAPDPPYCLYHYSVLVRLGHSDDSAEEIGQIFITLEGTQRDTQKLLTPFSQSFVPGQEYRYLVTIPYEIGYLKSVKLLWIRTSGGPPSSHEIIVNSVYITLMNGTNDAVPQIFKSCQQRSLKSDGPQRYMNEALSGGSGGCL